ncbi:hypothetical protein [Galbibacter sp.]|uniref:hypothetical protein n=1 Tax=Galbibacter sp. TaxID=2918471 RepID=UPI003A8F196A
MKSHINLFTVKKESNTKNVDISKLVTECLGDKEYLNEIIVLLNDNIEEFYDTTEVCIKAKDRFSISRGAHKIKNGLEMVQAPVLLHYVDLIQKECQHLDTYWKIQDILNQFKTEYKLVLTSLYNQIECLDD